MVFLGANSSPPRSSQSKNGSGGSVQSGAGTESGSSGGSAGHVRPPVMNFQKALAGDRNPPESSGEEDSDEREGRIRVGKDYQVNIPNIIPESQRRPEQIPERALLVWSPTPNISAVKLDEYLQISKEKYGYNAEQALGMLFWHKHDLEKAVQDLSNFTPFPDEWSVEDKVLFEQAFQFHGKSFHRIRQMLPDKTIAQLVKYYYSWKKTRTRTSLMDRQARKLQVQRGEQPGLGEESTSGAASSNSSVSAVAEDSETEEDKEASKKPKCFNCGILCHMTHPTPKGQMCGTCHQYYVRTGNIRPTSAPIRKDGTKSKHSLFKNSNKPPKGMYVNHDDLVSLATGAQSHGEALLKSMDREIVAYKRAVQSNKQSLSSLKKRVKDRERSAIDPYRIPEPTSTASKINAKWTSEELLLGVQGVRKFGKNFRLIAEIIGTKTESHVRSFFVNYRRRYNLDLAFKEYETEHGPSPEEEGGESGQDKETESNDRTTENEKTDMTDPAKLENSG